MLRLISLCLVLLLATPVAAQGLYTNSPLSCVRLPGLVTVLRNVVNEPQIIPIITGQRLSTDVLRGQGDCTYNNRTIVEQNFIGWIQTDRWLVPLEQVCYETDNPTWPDCGHWRPADLLRSADWKLPNKCVNRLSETRGGITIIGRNTDWQFLEWRCGQPIRKF